MVVKVNVRQKSGQRESGWGKNPGIEVMLLIMAFFLDIIGLIPGVGFVISFIPDIIGMLTIGVYDWTATGKMPMRKKTKQFFFRKAGARSILELLPITGILPLWTVYVLKQMRK